MTSRSSKFEAGKLLEGQTSVESVSAADLTETFHEIDLDTVLRERLVALPPLEIGSNNPDAEMRSAGLAADLGLAQIQQSAAAIEMMSSKQFTVGAPETLHLVHLSAADLGFPEGGVLKEIRSHAYKLGLKPVPAEAGPRLALDFKKPVHGAPLILGMESIPSITGDSYVFGVTESGNKFIWLLGYNVDAQMASIVRFVFRKP